MMGRYKVMTGEFADLMLGYYGETIAERNPEVIELAQKNAKKPVITGRPADLLKPEWDDLRAQALGLNGLQRVGRGCPHAGDVPPGGAEVLREAPRGTAQREQEEGPPRPKSAGRPGAPAAASAGAPDSGQGPVRTPITYEVTLNGKTHKVSIAPAN